MSKADGATSQIAKLFYQIHDTNQTRKHTVRIFSIFIPHIGMLLKRPFLGELGKCTVFENSSKISHLDFYTKNQYKIKRAAF